MGFVDRGGGREAKGSSLRRSKKNPGAASTRNKSQNKNYVAPTQRTVPSCPPMLQPLIKAMAAYYVNQPDMEGNAVSSAENVKRLLGEMGVQLSAQHHVDAATAILARKLEADLENVLRRACEDGQLSAMICWSNELERQQLLLETCRSHNSLARQQQQQQNQNKNANTEKKKVHFQLQKELTTANSGSKMDGDDITMYCILGIHVNNIDRMNKKIQEQWIETLRADAKNKEVVGVLSGLNLSREGATHYTQEFLLKECWSVAGEFHLPLVLHLCASDDEHLVQTVDRATEILNELFASAADGNAPSSVVLYNGIKVVASSKAMQDLVRNHKPVAPAAPLHSYDDNKTVDSIPMYVMATAEGLTELPEDAEGLEADRPRIKAELVSLLPLISGNGSKDNAEAVVSLSQLLVGTGSPWGTPQNMPDAYTCTLPNEPGNYQYVLEAIYKASTRSGSSDVSMEQFSEVVLQNLMWVFFADTVFEEVHRLQKGEGSGSDDDEASDSEDGDDEDEKKVTSEAQAPAAATAPPVVKSTDGLVPAPGALKSAAAFSCVRCRAALFSQSACVTHLPPSNDDAAANQKGSQKKNKKRGGNANIADGDCSSTHVLRVTVDKAAVAKLEATLGYVDTDELLAHIKGIEGVSANKGVSSVRLHGSNATCAQCTSKIGSVRYDGPCACGCTLPGMTLRVQTSRVELLAAVVAAAAAGSSDPSESAQRSGGKANEDDELQALLAAAARERERLEEERIAEELAAAQHADDDGNKKRKEKKKNVKANNRSNFTHFRNKDFAPKQSKEKKIQHLQALEGRSSDDDEEQSSDEDVTTTNQTTQDGARGHAGKAHVDPVAAEAEAEASDAESEEEPATMMMMSNASRRNRKKQNKKRQQQQQHVEQSGSDDDSD